MDRASVKSHNQATFRSLDEGDIVKFSRGPYYHVGVKTIGDDVVHYGQDKGRKVCVQKENFFSICKNSKAEKFNHWDDQFQPVDKTEIVRCAESVIGEKGYNILSNNCEHFATFCRYGIPISNQAKTAIWIITAVVLLIVIIITTTIIFTVTYLIRRSKTEEENSIICS